MGLGRDEQGRKFMTGYRLGSKFTAALFGASVALLAHGAAAADAKHYTFGYDQPHTTGYGIAGDTFAAKLKELSKDTMLIDQFPGAQLGQEPQMLQKIRTGDIDFIISSTANAATVAPEAGVFRTFHDEKIVAWIEFMEPFFTPAGGENSAME